MSGSYEVDGVKVTPVGGGYYDLEHTSLSEPQRMQGKEKAEQRAREIAQGSAGNGNQQVDNNGGHAPGTGGADTGSMEPQGGLPNNFQSLTAEQAIQNAEQSDNGGKPPEGEKSAEDVKDGEIAALKALLAEETKRREAIEKAAAPIVKTVAASDEKPESYVPGSVPRRYEGSLDKDAKQSLKKAGVNYVTIVLDDNDSIPPTGLFLGHNGRGYVIVPGGEVDVPEFLLGVLDDAKMAAPIVDSKTQKVLGYRERMRYSYRRV